MTRDEGGAISGSVVLRIGRFVRARARPRGLLRRADRDLRTDHRGDRRVVPGGRRCRGAPAALGAACMERRAVLVPGRARALCCSRAGRTSGLRARPGTSRRRSWRPRRSWRSRSSWSPSIGRRSRLSYHPGHVEWLARRIATMLARKRHRTVNMHEAKTHLSELVDAAERGERITIARNGKPAVVLVPAGVSRRAPAGMHRGRVRVADDFNEPLPDEYSGLEGR